MANHARENCKSFKNNSTQVKNCNSLTALKNRPELHNKKTDCITFWWVFVETNFCRMKTVQSTHRHQNQTRCTSCVAESTETNEPGLLYVECPKHDLRRAIKRRTWPRPSSWMVFSQSSPSSCACQFSGTSSDTRFDVQVRGSSGNACRGSWLAIGDQRENNEPWPVRSELGRPRLDVDM